MSEDREAEQKKARRTLVRVMIVQVITLLLLWLLQARYTT